MPSLAALALSSTPPPLFSLNEMILPFNKRLMDFDVADLPVALTELTDFGAQLRFACQAFRAGLSNNCVASFHVLSAFANRSLKEPLTLAQEADVEIAASKLLGEGFSLLSRSRNCDVHDPEAVIQCGAVLYVSVIFEECQVVADAGSCPWLSGTGASVSVFQQPHYRVTSVGKFPGAFQWDLLFALDKKYWNVLKVRLFSQLYSIALPKIKTRRAFVFPKDCNIC